MNEMKKYLLLFMVISAVFPINAQVESWDPDWDGDNNVGVSDLLGLLSVFGDYDLDNDGIWDSVDDCVGEYDECGVCNGEGIPEGYCTCEIPIDAIGVCGGDCAQDYNGDGICDLYEVPGCMDPNACNYDENATYDDGSCEFSGEGAPGEVCNDGDDNTINDLWNESGCECEGEPAVGVNGPCFNQSSIEFNGSIYHLVEIGSQCWFRENLRTDKDTNGNPLNYEDLAFCNDDPSTINEYGLLYSENILNSLCPQNWHVPNSEEANTLIAVLGGDYIAGGAVKSTVLNSPSWDGTNIAGFDLVPTGRVQGSVNSGFGSESIVWTSSSYGISGLYNTVFGAATGTLQIIEPTIMVGWKCSVRCLRD